jgi:lipoprotein-anchoring transpeptidase ErfK/SrfK
MPFMQRITWSGIALHAGVLPGYPASHGCIRLPSRQAKRFYHAVRVGTPVFVYR